MKVWIEYPEGTRFARRERDILYTPIYFANEDISAYLRLDNEWRATYGEDLDSLFTARAKLIGKATLGFLSVGGRPVNGADMRYGIPSLGYRPIYTLEILDIFKRVSLVNLEYDATDGIRGGRVPFKFQLPTATLEDLQQLASSMKVITADNMSTMGLLKGVTPALIVSVTYTLSVEILDNTDAQVKSHIKDEIRIFVSLSQEQVPTSAEPAVVGNPMAKFVTTQVVPMNAARGRRGSIPIIRRLSRPSAQESNFMTISVDNVEPFAFTRASDAAASKVTISLLYNNENATQSDTPPAMQGTVNWMMKSLTTLTLEPMGPETSPQQVDEYFHLRAKILPIRKLKLRWSEWQLSPESTEARPRWISTQAVWLIKDITAGMTPSYTTPYLSHTYYLNLQVSLESEQRGFGAGKQKVELDVPIQIRYDLGLVPSYEIDPTLPDYDNTLPEYEELEHTGSRVEVEVAGENGVTGSSSSTTGTSDADDLLSLGNLNLDLDPVREESGDDIPPPVERSLHPAQRMATN